MTDEAPATVPPPDIAATLTAAWATFRTHTKILLQAYGVFAGVNIVIAVVFGLISQNLNPLLGFLLMTLGSLPSILLVPGLYSIALKCVRGQKAEVKDLLLLFQDRFIHHVGLLLLQVCGFLACGVGVIVTMALFVPGSFLVIDRKMDWDGAMERCVEHIKPKIVPWILFSLVVALVAFAGVLACGVGVLVTGPLALCAWAHAYDRSFKSVA
jgi:hypothetical protein